MLRIGLCGTGDAATHHARALLALEGEGELRLTAIAARSVASVERLRAAVLPGAGAASGARDALALDSLGALLASGACDAVILATPDGLHAEQVVAAARAGLHVLVEKPLGLSLAEGRAATEAARAAGTALMVGYHLRHHAGHRALRDAIPTRVGEARHVYVRWAWPDPKTDGWRARGDHARFFAMAALGTHAVDLCLWLVDQPVRAVTGALVLEGPTDRAAEVTLTFEGGAIGHVSVSVRERATSRLIVSGPLGELECTGSLGARGDGELGARARGVPFTPMTYVAENPYMAQLRAFVGAARGGTIDPCALPNLAALDMLSPLLSPHPHARPHP